MGLSMNYKTVKVLFIEGNPVDAKFVVKILQNSKEYETAVINIENLPPAFENLDKEHFEIILLDLELKNERNLNIINELHKKLPAVAILVIDKSFHESNALKALECGANEYITREEISDANLNQSITYALKRTEMHLKQHQKSDITSIKNSFKSAEKNYGSVIDNIGVGIAILSPNMEILDLNKQMKEWYPKINIQKKPFCYKAFNKPPREEICTYCPTYKSLEDGKVHEAITNTPMGNKIINFRIVSSAIEDSDGNIIAAIEMVEDITDRIKAENAHRESEEKFRAVTESSPDAHVTIDSKGNISLFNHSFLELFGYSASEISGKPVITIIPDKTKKYHMKGMETFGSGSNVRGKTTLATGLKKDGTEFPCELSLSSWNLGKKIYFTSIIRDLTERKQSENAIKKSEKQLQDIINHLPDATFAIDCKGKIILWNKALEDMTGANAENMIGKNNYEYTIPFYGVRKPILIDLIFKDDDELLKSHYFNIKRDNKSIMAETILSDFHGKDIFLWGKASPLYDENKKMVGAIESIRDITDMKKIDVELHEYRENLEKQVEDRTQELAKTNEKLKNVISKHESTEIELAKLVMELKRSNKELEQFAYVASHDLQEPLRMVSSFTQLLERQYKDKLDENAYEYIKYAVDGAKRMQKLINDLLAYSRVTTKGDNFTEINAEEVVEQALFDLEIVIKENDAEIIVDPLPKIYADRSQMIQLFQNLIGNAIKYRSDDVPHIHISAQKGEEEWIFQVSDNGIGIDSEYYDRIFQIFQRLHEMHVYSGTGVGLAICKKIVERHGGRIWLDSEVGKGSTFYLSIPEVK